MTKNQMLSRMEQMDAIRRDFHKWFNQQSLSFCDTKRERGAAMHNAWQAWVACERLKHKNVPR